ncbi:hypothetical protein IAU60_003997 [Kwoniella sp. DSM 27419]
MPFDPQVSALEAEFDTLALNLRNMWYQHGYTGLRYFKSHIADIYSRFQNLLDQDRVDAGTLRAAMSACDELLALKTVPNESYLAYVVGIRQGISQTSPTATNVSSPEDSPLEERGMTTFAPVGMTESFKVRAARRASS